VSSISSPGSSQRGRTLNTGVLMREAFRAVNDLVVVELASRGHEQIRPAHAAVFQYLDDGGTTVSVLATRAQMTKQAMAELVRHLETHQYVVRVPDPADGRAKLVQPTDRGQEVFRVAQEVVPRIEELIAETIGPRRVTALRRDLDAIRRAARSGLPG
jgi:DNA-binding MarR family transcriptional regulator